ncbi:MAG: hypothetical protein N2483_02625 [Burkholderiaceae bacterium]|nr:hypothetical protein [Burkholderiaceae bacterium]
MAASFPMRVPLYKQGLRFLRAAWLPASCVLVCTVTGVALGLALEEYQSSTVLTLASPGGDATNASRFLLFQLERRHLSAPDRAADRASDRWADRSVDRVIDREAAVFVPAMRIPDYRRALSSFASATRFTLFAQHRGIDDHVRRHILVHFQDGRRLAALFNPVYSQTRQDIREVGETKLDRAEPLVYALRISFNAATPAAAVAGVTALAEYVQDSLLRDAVQTHVITQAAVARSIKQSADFQSLERRFAIAQLEASVHDLHKLLRRYPTSARFEARQLVSVEGGGEKFLSPVAQIIGAESRLSEVRRELERLERLSHQADAILRFIAAAEPLAMRQDLPARQILEQLIERLRADLAGNEGKDEAIRAGLLALLTLFTDLRSIHVDQIRLLADPSLPDRPEPPTRLQIGATGALLGLFIALLLQVARRRRFGAAKDLA